MVMEIIDELLHLCLKLYLISHPQIWDAIFYSFQNIDTWNYILYVCFKKKELGFMKSADLFERRASENKQQAECNKQQQQTTNKQAKRNHPRTPTNITDRRPPIADRRSLTPPESDQRSDQRSTIACFSFLKDIHLGRKPWKWAGKVR